MLPPSFAYRYHHHRESRHRHRNGLGRLVGSDVEPARADIKQKRDHFAPRIERGALHWQSQMRTHGGHQRQSG